jgi:hypothetical protein
VCDLYSSCDLIFKLWIRLSISTAGKSWAVLSKRDIGPLKDSIFLSHQIFYCNSKKYFNAIAERIPCYLKHLVSLGVIESIGRGRSTQYMLCKKYYLHVGKSGVYTRKQGLDRDTNKELLLKHIRANQGARLSDLCQVLPFLSDDQVRTLLKELKHNNLIHVRGKTKAGLWFFGPEESNLKPNSNLIPT